jgi:hypothetical protein
MLEHIMPRKGFTQRGSWRSRIIEHLGLAIKLPAVETSSSGEIAD